MEVKIFGISTVSEPKPNYHGDMILAFIDFTADFVTMKGAALVKLKSGGLTVWEPMAKSDRKPERSARMAGFARREVAQAALPLFEAMGGDVDRAAGEPA